MSEAVRAQIEAKAREIGFDSVGVSPARVSERDQKRLHRFVEQGEYGTMDWMAANLDRRESPTGLWNDVRSILVLGSNYGPDHDPMDNLADSNRANISVYARNRDYHDRIKKQLKQLGRWMGETFGCELKVFVDTAPVMEKPIAAQTAVGWQGKHSCVVSREFGSWLFLSEIYTTLELPADEPEGDRCGNCTRCQDVCPTKAFPRPYQLDARRCISYLTIEHQGPIPHEFREAMGNRVYGCDDCLAVCPWNRFAQQSREAAFVARDDLRAPALTDFLNMDDATFRSFFTKSPIKRSGRERFLRNVLIALGNSGNPGVVEEVKAMLLDPAPVLRGAAVWALSRLMAREAFAALKARYESEEADAGVLEEWQREQ